MKKHVEKIIVWIFRLYIRVGWFFLPIIGTTLNEFLGGEKVTGLRGNYEQSSPEDLFRKSK